MKSLNLALAALLLCLCSAGAAPAQIVPGGDAPVEIEDDESTTAEDTRRPQPVQKAAPFKELAGRWVGDGRVGFKEGKTESVKCRATYFISQPGDEVKQTIRCASAGGKVEVKSNVLAKDGRLSGSWNELVYNLGGDLKGEVTERGFRISVQGSGLTANMDVIVMNERQIVEIQFFNSTLRGLTLVLKKG